MAATKYLIIIAGPTAIGKTALSIEMAKMFDADIISSDSRQYYKELSIGTAKPSIEERDGVVHHFIDSLSIHDYYSIGKYERDVIAMLDQRFIAKDVMIMTGGSGMHIRAITHGLDDFPEVPDTIKDRWEAIFEQEGLAPLQEAIKKLDPEYAKVVDMDNSRRLIRALSVTEADNQPFSSYLNQPAKERPFTPIYIMLERDREDLYSRINHRVDIMISAGLEAEAQAVLNWRNLKALNTIGYKELFDYFDGKTDLDRAIDLIKRNSRRYAKRQMTWFRKEDYWNRYDADKTAGILAFVRKEIENL